MHDLGNNLKSICMADNFEIDRVRKINQIMLSSNLIKLWNWGLGPYDLDERTPRMLDQLEHHTYQCKILIFPVLFLMWIWSVNYVLFLGLQSLSWILFLN